MAILGVLTNAQVIVNGVDLSTDVEKVTVSDERSKVPITAMGATANGYTKGLGDATIKLTFYQNMSAGRVHATLQPLINSTTPVQVEVRGLNAARSATNPAFVLASALMFNYTGLDGGATDNNASKTEVEFSNASSAGGMSYLIA